MLKMYFDPQSAEIGEELYKWCEEQMKSTNGTALGARKLKLLAAVLCNSDEKGVEVDIKISPQQHKTPRNTFSV